MAINLPPNNLMMLIYWALVVAVLGWLYAGWAALWPWLFARDVVRHGRRVPEGFQIGRAIVWRLPLRGALLLMLLAALPLLAVLVLPAGWAAAVLAVGGGLVVAAWLFLSPGSRLLMAEAMGAGQPPAFRLRRPRAAGRAVAVLIVFGVVPALLVGQLVAAALR